MKQAELVAASNELNELLFDAKAKEDGWIDTTGKNVKKMVKGIKEAAEIMESDEELTEETLATLRKIDWNLDDYDEDTQKDVQKNLQALGVWLNEEDEENDDDAEEDEKPKKKKAATKKKTKDPEADQHEDDDDDDEDEVEKKPKKKVTKKAAPKGDKGTRLDTLCEALKKKPKTFAEWTEKANDLWVSKGGSDSVKESASMSKYVNIITAHFAPDVKFPSK